MKAKGKAFVVKVLSWQVRRLAKKHNFKIVAVAGSIGKTSTKFAIAGVLKRYFKVQMQDGNYNDIVTVPLVFFGQKNPPSLMNPFAWLKILVTNELKLLKTYPYEIVLVELGTDGPGQLQRFSGFIKPDVSVLTAISPEHMEFFGSIEAVAEEELQVTKFSKKTIVSIDDVPGEYLGSLHLPITYGLDDKAEYRLQSHGEQITLSHGKENIKATTKLAGKHLQKALAAAVAVAEQLGVTMSHAMAEDISQISPVPGRMQVLAGKNGATIIDDTYNNVAPEPVIAALDVLYEWPAEKRIAVLGNMNELGHHAKDAHIKVGQYCDPSRLNQVLTIGPDANKFLAEEAKKAGNQVTSFESPHDIGKTLVSQLAEGTVILIKGSQNRVFLEEAIKPLLENQADINKLVRQSKSWLKHKAKQFTNG